ncbi:Clp protease ClpB [Neobacillus sp. 19]|uniref:phage scaffolding protein n=1 Tax=Neobacillus sp. 19 TaxID=3394458 RepID=UPI003BF67DE8
MSEELKNEVVTENHTVEEPVQKPEVKTVTMSQEELDALIGREKGRVKSKYADYNDLKAKLAELESAENKRKEAEMSELELLQKRLEEKDGTAQSLAKQLEDLQSQVQREKVLNAFIKAAPGVNIPADRIDAALKLADLSAVTVGENGVEGLDAVMGALVEQYAFLADTKKPQKPIGEATNSHKETADKTSEQLLKDAVEKAKRTGRIEDRMAVAALKRELDM